MTIPEIPPAHREAVAYALEKWTHLRNAPDAADAAIATLLQLGYRVAPGWVACSERMPEDSRTCAVLRYSPFHGRKAFLGCWHNRAWFDGGGGYGYDDVTHWQPLSDFPPLPPPPPSAPALTTDNKDANT